MNTAPIIARLWDHGWLCRDSIELSAATSDLELIHQYITSTAFNTSFLPNDKNETGLHGPFLTDRIHAEDFIPLPEASLETYLRSMEFSKNPGDDISEQAKLRLHFQAAFAGGNRCYRLRRDERDKELFHEWGSVLFVFREFLFVSPQRDKLERFVVGYD